MGLLLEYAGKKPRVGERVYLAPTASVIGDVVLDDDVSIWFNSVVRGDCHFIRVGAPTRRPVWHDRSPRRFSTGKATQS